MPMRKSLLPSLLISLTTTLAAYAGTFTTDFNSGLPAGTAVYGSALVDTTGGVGNSGCLKMTTNAVNQNAGFIINDLESGAAINAFTATFQLVLGSASGTPADGFSFNYAGDVPDGTIDEEGAPVTSGLTVEFDTFTNNATTDLLGIDVKWNGTEIATRSEEHTSE